MSYAVVEYTKPAEWDALVYSHPRGHLLQSWAWGELKGDFGWRPLRLAVVDAAGVPRAAAQVLIRGFMGLSVCYVPRGPLFADQTEANFVLCTALRHLARRHRAAFLRLEPNVLESDPEANELHSWLQVDGFRVADSLQPRSSLHLDLEPEPDRLFAAFARSHRADVRRSERAGVKVRVGTTPTDLDAFYTIMKVTAERAGFGVHSRAYYQRAWELGGDSARLLIASDASGADVAGFLVFAAGREGQYMYSGANAAGLKSYANYLLQWNAIRWARERGCQVYDFWGIPDAAARLLQACGDAERSAIEQELEAHPLYGVYLFKKGWGGRIVRYLPAYDQVYLAPAYWLWQKRQGGE